MIIPRRKYYNPVVADVSTNQEGESMFKRKMIFDFSKLSLEEIKYQTTMVEATDDNKTMTKTEVVSVTTVSVSNVIACRTLGSSHKIRKAKKKYRNRLSVGKMCKNFYSKKHEKNFYIGYFCEYIHSQRVLCIGTL